jgi:hypothetical protein
MSKSNIINNISPSISMHNHIIKWSSMKNQHFRQIYLVSDLSQKNDIIMSMARIQGWESLSGDL